jgi:hypothetical protein
MEIEELSKKIEELHKMDKEKNEQRCVISVGLASIGFGLAIFNTWLNSSNHKDVNLILAGFLFVIGIVCFVFSNKIKI